MFLKSGRSNLSNCIFKISKFQIGKIFIFFEKLIVCYKFSNSSVFFTPYCRARKDLSENVWVVALIVYRFRDRRKKHPWLFYVLKFKIPNTRLVNFPYSGKNVT